VVFKRILDIILSILGLVILSPVLAVIYILVRIKIGTPVFFSQKRPGKDEKIFYMYKFRSMTNEKDEMGRLLPDDKRLTRFGTFLRKTSIDELPELFNVLKGDMSLVGPRPLLVEYLPLYSEEQKERHNMKPGITGWAQVNGRNAISWQEKFKLDVWYVRNWSLKLDFKIIGMTFKKVFNSEGISQSGHATVEKFTGND
jgi:sugar transferase EpsL